MLLTIRTTHEPATDLGFLLHKHPDHVHTRAFPFGSATVLYPEASEEGCTAAVLLDVDPVGIVRGRGGKGGAEDQDVNDRPYVASSLLSVVLSRWFNSALSGRCERKPELASSELPLEVRLSAVPCRGGEELLRELFEPLGYDVDATRHPLDDSMPAFGPSRLFSVTLRATRRLSDLLTHLYVLIPVLDDQKHYWVGDDEVEKLLRRAEGWLDAKTWHHPEGRKAVFVGDLVDRGPRIADTLAAAMSMSASGAALCVPGNHDIKLKRKLEGRDVVISHGLNRTLAELDRQTPKFRADVHTFLDGLVSHYVFDEGRLVVAHAGMKEEMQGRGSAKVRDFALFGETTGETDDFGRPVRNNWALEYRGRSAVVYGHTPVPEPEWLNRTMNIDTGCVFGGRLTALRWPEKELVSVAARQAYADPARPFLPAVGAPSLSAQQANDDLLDIDDVRGKRLITTRLHRSVTIREENAAAALEVMSRFAANPKWLIYLPPTMSPTETAKTDGLLEHPAEAFAYYRANGVSTVVVEQKHMGSRAVLIVCGGNDVARERFGILEDEEGICYTRTGRRFFDNAALERELLATVRGALEQSGFWERFNTNWVCLDCELMPWSAKALELVRQQYASVGTAARVSLGEAVSALERTAARGVDVATLLERHRTRQDLADRFARAYRTYCWPVESLRDIRIAPFHVMATEGAVHADKDHAWHMNAIGSFVGEGRELLMATPYHVVNLAEAESEASVTQWWTSLTETGGEGVVMKPMSFVATGSRGLLQPAIKCRGREYLRIIYGPEYTLPEHLGRLRDRGVSGKRSLALREFALGIEGLERFVQREPLRRIHECVFGVLALESEPVDPRL